MNPLANEWAIKHRADACALTNRPFAPGEYFYTLLFRNAEGFHREDLSEEAWQNRNENIRPFSFWKARYELAPPAPADPLGKESAEQLFRRLLSSKNAPAPAMFLSCKIRNCGSTSSKPYKTKLHNYCAAPRLHNRWIEQSLARC